MLNLKSLWMYHMCPCEYTQTRVYDINKVSMNLYFHGDKKKDNGVGEQLIPLSFF